MDITDEEILRAERYGSRDYEVAILGQCSCCGNFVVSDEAEGCRDRFGNLFCSRECFESFYGFRETEMECGMK